MYSWKAGTAMRNMITLEKRFIERVVKVAIKKKTFGEQFKIQIVFREF